MAPTPPNMSRTRLIFDWYSSRAWAAAAAAAAGDAEIGTDTLSATDVGSVGVAVTLEEASEDNDLEHDVSPSLHCSLSPEILVC